MPGAVRWPRHPPRRLSPPLSPPLSGPLGSGEGGAPSGPHESGAAAGGPLVSALTALRVRDIRRERSSRGIEGCRGGWGLSAAAGYPASLPETREPPATLEPRPCPHPGQKPFDYDLRSDETTR